MSKLKYYDEIQRLDPEVDHQRIVYLDTVFEFPWDGTRALEFALFRTYAIPSISKLLDQTGEFYTRPQKRYDDTSLIMAEIYEHGYDSERGRAALRSINRQHGQYTISNEDFLYVASTFVFEPARWMARFGWRPFSKNEKLGLFNFWRELAKRMAIKDFPDTYEAFEQFNLDYERKYFVYNETNKNIGNATVNLFLGWYLPKFLHGLGRPVIYAMLDDALITAFGFPKPSPVLRWLAESGLKFRSAIVRLFPERNKPAPYTAKRQRSYPNGYSLDDFGPPRVK